MDVTGCTSSSKMVISESHHTQKQRRPRPRKKIYRSSTGCRTCKLSKVKCDEAKPACSRCIARRLTCPGYPVETFRWSSKHEVHKFITPESQQAEQDERIEALPQDAMGDLASISPAQENLVTIPPEEWELDGANFLARQLLNDFAREHHVEVSNSALFDITNSNLGPPIVSSDTNIASGSYSPHSLAFSSLNASNQHEILFDSTLNQDYIPQSQRQKRAAGMEDNDYYTTPESSDIAAMEISYAELADGEIVDNNNSPNNNLTASTTSASLVSRVNGQTTSICPTLLHIPTALEEYYFQKVCQECSTFDSDNNPFRSVVLAMRCNSAPLYYTIQSLAASKLSHDLSQMKITGIEAQGKALRYLNEACSKATALRHIPDDVLYTTLLLGMTTSWHFPNDIGLEYLLSARRIIKAKIQMQDMVKTPNLRFYQDALKYWEMVVSMVSAEAEIDTLDDDELSTPCGPLLLEAPIKKIMPHPWTGISSKSQELFGKALKLVHRIRNNAHKKGDLVYSRSNAMDILNTITAAEQLEAECWSTKIPLVEDIQDTGDSKTPPIHHVLTAKAYLLSGLLHIYMMFPDVLQARMTLLSGDSTASILEEPQSSQNLTRMLSKSQIWPERSIQDPPLVWLKDVGFRIVECLEGIDVQSGTRAIHPALLLSVSSALTMPPPTFDKLDHISKPSQIEPEHIATSILYKDPVTETNRCFELLNIKIRQCRQFIINRLELMYALMRFQAINNILKIIREVWKRSDEGSLNVFWMDVMYELGCETLFG